MAESITRSVHQNEAPLLQSAQQSEEVATTKQENATLTSQRSTIIWTPSFIVIFALTLAAGLSLASLTTQGWDNRLYQPGWILLGNTAILGALWVAIVIRTRSLWVRIGGSFACLWVIFTAINFIAGLLSVDAGLSAIAYLNAATNIALLASYIVFSTNGVPFRGWDRWFFKIAPIIGGCLALTGFFFPPPLIGLLPSLASTTAAAALYLAIAAWWLRPSCWKTQAGPAFFLGVAPTILLMLSIPHAFNGSSNFFFLQVSLLSSILGAMRLLQGELRQRVTIEQAIS
ncbi:hypothetical protein KSF_068380 [Reticulibacter mediterranei]|uniref:Uncharacterized protein n=1 Tax=Reticulibacter mediterranei TaxID=2778369 RepID=A0A8J3N5V8_9CHLR|nr:hypothetical protein [Reticulibacter mediterranei]GHO96790.1 hypothetical protein KSF_068380 [Reticulibacter mediterranei]